MGERMLAVVWDDQRTNPGPHVWSGEPMRSAGMSSETQVPRIDAQPKLRCALHVTPPADASRSCRLPCSLSGPLRRGWYGRIHNLVDYTKAQRILYCLSCSQRDRGMSIAPCHRRLPQAYGKRTPCPPRWWKQIATRSPARLQPRSLEAVPARAHPPSRSLRA